MASGSLVPAPVGGFCGFGHPGRPVRRHKPWACFTLTAVAPTEPGTSAVPASPESKLRCQTFTVVPFPELGIPFAVGAEQGVDEVAEHDIVPAASDNAD